MTTFQPGAIRNVGLFGHMGNGKTSIAEAMLHAAGAISRLGRVDEGTSTSDYDPDEHRRRMSVNLSLLPLTWHGTKVNVIDVPGYADFVGDDAFFAVLRDWPASQENGNADREEYWDWIERTTGEELSAFFDDWLLGEETPPR